MAVFDKSVDVVTVTGPTACGKTALAVKLAKEFDGEVVSIDSRQVYRGLDIGSGKDIVEYGELPYHLIDIADPAVDTYNLYRFCNDAFSAIADISERGKLPVLCGGTALYLAALLNNYTLPGEALPERKSGAERCRQSGTVPAFQAPFKLRSLTFGVLFPRSAVRDRIEKRLDARIEAGLVDEVRKLHDEKGVSWEKLEFFGLEYREVAKFLQGECSHEEMRLTLLNRIRQFAKRQDIFFRKLEREGQDIYWISGGVEPDPCRMVAGFLAGQIPAKPDFRLCDHSNAPIRKSKR